MARQSLWTLFINFLLVCCPHQFLLRWVNFLVLLLYFLSCGCKINLVQRSQLSCSVDFVSKFWKWVFKHLFTNILVLSLSLADQNVPISWPQRGDISFENVSLRYEGQRQNVIGQLNLKIPAGQRVSAVAAAGNKWNHSSYCKCMYLCVFVCVFS